MFKVGDLVRCVDNSKTILLEGKDYCVSGTNLPEGKIQVSGMTMWYFANRFELVRSVLAEPSVILPPAPAGQGGMKYDGGKLRRSMLDKLRPVLAEVCKVLEFGAAKYAENSWHSVPDALRRYRDASERHWDAQMAGEKCDVESKLPHWAHKLCNDLFVAWLCAYKPELLEAEQKRHG